MVLMRFDWHTRESELFSSPCKHPSIYGAVETSHLFCACCGRKTQYAYSMESNNITNKFGHGYAVCLNCYLTEVTNGKEGAENE